MSLQDNNCNSKLSTNLLDINNKLIENSTNNQINNHNNNNNNNNDDVNRNDSNDSESRNIKIDAHEFEMFQLVCDEYKIAEALAKTTALTSTIQLKQRLLARKLELERHDKDVNNARLSIDFDIEGYEPPRDILLYLVRMGSFNSMPKINNTDSQDDGLKLPLGLNFTQLLKYLHTNGQQQQQHDTQPPTLLQRRFFNKHLLPSEELSTLSSCNNSVENCSEITNEIKNIHLKSICSSAENIGHREERVIYNNSISLNCNNPSTQIRLLQWNLLSQTLGQSNDGFICCTEEVLSWKHRKYLIIEELLRYQPDIICLQEVDHFKFLQNVLGNQNYEGFFVPKPDSPCLYIENNNGPDGCAVFFKSNKFKLENYTARILQVWRVQSNQVAIAVNLIMKETNQKICVCTTHLKARHGTLLSKLRDEQGRDLLRFVKSVAANRPILLSGDFNAEPNEPVYSTILRCDLVNLGFGSAYADVHKINKDSSSNKNNDNNDTDASAFEKNDGDTCHNNTAQLTLNERIQKSIDNEPPYTTWKIREEGEICHTIDYIFYSRQHLKVINCLSFPHGDEIGSNRTPNLHYPSDHFSLVSDFIIHSM